MVNLNKKRKIIKRKKGTATFFIDAIKGWLFEQKEAHEKYHPREREKNFWERGIYAL